jgi:hypothetical protein
MMNVCSMIRDRALAEPLCKALPIDVTLLQPQKTFEFTTPLCKDFGLLEPSARCGTEISVFSWKAP